MKKYAVFTIDFEAFSDTECVANAGAKPKHEMLDGLEVYLRLLERYHIQATIFTLWDVVKSGKDFLKSAISRGHRMALHGLHHVAPIQQTEEAFRNEVRAAKELLEKEFGVKVNGYRAPFFSLDSSRLNILRQLGFRYDASRMDFDRARHSASIDISKYRKPLDETYCDKDFCEFGLAHSKLFGMNYPISGGGYVRLCNWQVLKPAIRRYLRQSNCYIFYLHPFELSAQRQSVIPGLKLYDQFYLHFGRRNFAAKIESIIQMLLQEGYEFVTLDELSDIVLQG